ncbi:MAG: hypothetical protein K6E84_04015 [Lachnospiraceae bacterium]|nr:hypothetical protein [Lachnospiraceae bacterium]
MPDVSQIPLGYVKKKDLPGSDNGIRYLFRSEDGGLTVWVWPEPYGFAATDESLKQSRRFELSREGIAEAVAWINEMKP